MVQLQTLSALRQPLGIQMPDPIAKQQTLASLANTMQAGQLQGQQLQQNQDAMQADARVSQVLQNAKFDENGLDPQSRQALIQLGTPHALQIVSELDKNVQSKKTADLNEKNVNDQIKDRDLTRTTAAAQLQETIANNAAGRRQQQDTLDFQKQKEVDAAKLREHPPQIKGTFGVLQLNPETGQYETVAGTEPQPKQDKNVDPLSPEGITRQKELKAFEAGLKPAAEAQPLDTETTMQGRQYVNVSKLTGNAKNAAIASANKAGVPTVDSAGADALSNIDTARKNLEAMNQVLQPYLASSAWTRPLTGIRNLAESATQYDDSLAAVGTYRNAAIQAMRAVAGSKGLRINNAEIQMAIDNDIPKLTDTAAVAVKKMEMIKKFLDDSEQSLLVKDRSSGATANPPAGKPKSDPLGIR